MWVLLGLLSYINVKVADLHTDSDIDIEISYLPVRNRYGGKSVEKSCSSWHSRSKMICI